MVVLFDEDMRLQILLGRNLSEESILEQKSVFSIYVYYVLFSFKYLVSLSLYCTLAVEPGGGVIPAPKYGPKLFLTPKYINTHSF